MADRPMNRGRKARKKVCGFCVDKMQAKYFKTKELKEILQDLRDLYLKDQRFFLAV